MLNSEHCLARSRFLSVSNAMLVVILASASTSCLHPLSTACFPAWLERKIILWDSWWDLVYNVISTIRSQFHRFEKIGGCRKVIYAYGAKFSNTILKYVQS